MSSKISALPAAVSGAGSETVIVQGGANKRLALTELARTAAAANIADATATGVSLVTAANAAAARTAIGAGTSSATIPVTSAVLKGDGAGNGVAATPGTDFVAVAGSAAVSITLAPAANTAVPGFTLANTTAASAANQQYSPSLVLAGQGWKTTATAASQAVSFALNTVPVQGTTAPTGNLTITPSINGSATGYTVKISQSGGITTTDDSGQSFYAPNGVITAYNTTAIYALRVGTGSQGQLSANALRLANTQLILFSADSSALNTVDTGFARNAAGVGEVNNGTLGTYRNMILRAITAQYDALGSTPTAGITLQNTTAAAAGAQQYSPYLYFKGYGWKTDATAASQPVEFRAGVVPVQGAANPTGLLTFESSINGGAFGSAVTIDTSGTLGVQAGSYANPALRFGDLRGFYASSNGIIFRENGGGVPFGIDTGTALGIQLTNGSMLGWGAAMGSADTGVARNAAGVVEVNNGTLGTFRDLLLRYITIGGSSGSQVKLVKSATATLDFPSTAAQTSQDLTITVTGAAVGDTVMIGVPNGSVNANTSYTGWVSAADTVTIRHNNYSAAAVDPASGTFRATIIGF